MERYAWKALIKDGMLDEYICRHDKIWQEMKDVMIMEADHETGAQPKLTKVFSFNAE